MTSNLLYLYELNYDVGNLLGLGILKKHEIENKLPIYKMEIYKISSQNHNRMRPCKQ